MFKVEIIQDKDSLTVFTEKSTKLSEVLIKNNIATEHPCGCLGLCKKCTVLVNGIKELSCRYTVESDISVTVPMKNSIVSASGAKEDGMLTDNLCLCLDIGTTTLALALVSLDEKKTIRVINKNNPQRQFGADVMSRIEYCRKNGVTKLHSTLISVVNEMITDVLNEYGLLSTEKLYAAGNTTMLHLLFGVDCSSIGESPYTPSFLKSRRIKAESIGIANVSDVISLPNISAFIGADIVAGLNYVDLPPKGKFSLLIDLGTNAEVVLFSENKALCTAAAAGPCFEGANISCGMSATKGAIYTYSKNGYSVIGNAKPCGICATGLIDIVSELLKNEFLDESGYMERETYKIAEGVSITQEDIRQFQLAKSAVYSAVLSLISKVGITFDDIHKMYVSGGFSAKINIDSAIGAGLFPHELKDKFEAINNSSLLGTVKYACDTDNTEIFEKTAKYIDLACDNVFSELFIENIMFKEQNQ